MNCKYTLGSDNNPFKSIQNSKIYSKNSTSKKIPSYVRTLRIVT